MTMYEDPDFVKALKLLHSSAKDSTQQIFKILEDVMDQKFGGTKRFNLKYHNIIEELPTITLDAPKSRGSRGPSPIFLGEKSSRGSTPPSESLSIRTSPDRDDDNDVGLEIFEDDLFCTVSKSSKTKQNSYLLPTSYDRRAPQLARG